MLKTWAARHWAAHGTGPHGTGPHGTGPHGTGLKIFRDGAASGPSCHTPPCYLLRGTAALAVGHPWIDPPLAGASTCKAHAAFSSGCG